MIYVWDNRRLPCRRQFIEGKVISFLESLVGRIFVFVGIVWNYAHEKLIQRVLNALMVEIGHSNAAAPQPRPWTRSWDAFNVQPCFGVDVRFAGQAHGPSGRVNLNVNSVTPFRLNTNISPVEKATIILFFF
jgi:hypothetical protein